MDIKTKRFGMHVAILAGGLVSMCVAGPQAERVYLSGKGPADAVEWDFLCSGGRKSGEWTKIPVPSNWEQEGFGGYDYGHVLPDDKNAETGTYRTTFMVPAAWAGNVVRLVFEGAMTETSIKINGEPVGAPNQGGYNPFRFVLDKSNIKYGEENQLEVTVKKRPENRSLDYAERKADFWVFGGIYRPVYLEIQPTSFINRVAIDARANGQFSIEVFPQVYIDLHQRRDITPPVNGVSVQIQTLDGVDVGAPLEAKVAGTSGRVRLAGQIKQPRPWSPEQPNLYQAKVTLLSKGKPLCEMVQRFGFRTFELRPQDGLYLNGKKIRIKGVNRNVFRPETGRAINPEDAWEDARAIKSLNANLVRSHIPPTPAFMEACDELGLMTIAELCNWQAPSIDTPIARNITYELVTTYQNYPSVILWANGNEGGFNLELDELFHLYDLQDRPVLHPWALNEGLDTLHYPIFKHLKEKLNGQNLYLPTEFLHGLYDGGHGAGMEDYWREIVRSPLGAGGVLWCWTDDAISRTDQNGKLDTYGNCSADGIVGPHGEKEASYFTVRQIWAPIQIPLEKLPEAFDGSVPVENQYYDTSLNQCTFNWRLVKFNAPFADKAETRVGAQAGMRGPDVAPQSTGTLQLKLPNDWKQYDALQLEAVAPNTTTVMNWSWPIHSYEKENSSEVAVKQSSGNPFLIKQGNALWSFDPKNGQLLECSLNGKKAGLSNGPVLYASSANDPIDFSSTWKAEVVKQGDGVVVKSKDKASESAFTWTLSSDGTVALDYSFAPIDAKLTYCAVGFDLPEEMVAGKRWAGGGPHRIWANRLKGPRHGLWENSYNDVVTGQQWGAPEFKGVFGNVDWMRFNLKTGAMLLLDAETPTQIGVLTPKNAATAPKRGKRDPLGPINAVWSYPESGGLFLFHKVPSIGTKFKTGHQLGPQGEPEKIDGEVKGRVVFQIQ